MTEFIELIGTDALTRILKRSVPKHEKTIQTLPALAIHGVAPALFDAIDMSGYDEMLTVKAIKKYFHISINAAYNIIHTKGFPAIRIGNSIRVPRSMFIQWLKAQACYRP